MRIFNVHTKTVTLLTIPRLRNDQGFTYIGLLILLAILSVVTLGTVTLDAIVKRRHAEEELLRIGNDFRKALILYAINSPVGSSRYPSKLEDLCRDPRFQKPKRYLRMVLPDPLTGKTLWGIIRSPDGQGILGIYSLAEGNPIKIAMFDEEFREFTNSKTYQDWIFSTQVYKK